MAIVEITIKDRIATAPPDALLVCNNPTDTIRFLFDEEWNAHSVKTARFSWEGKYIDRVFEGNEVQTPEIFQTNYVFVGVFADNIASTPAKVRCRYSIKCMGGNILPPSADVYDQIIELINNGSGGSGGTVVSGVSSVNGKTGKVNLTAKDVGALPDTTEIPEEYVLPTASAEVMGGVKIGGGLVIDDDGVLRTTVPILIVEEPKDTGGNDGDTVTVTVNAVGVGLTYEWWYKNPDMANFVVSTAYADNYCSIPMTTARNGRQVYCVIRDAYGNALQTRTATLTLTLDGAGSTWPGYMLNYNLGKGLSVDEDMFMLNIDLTAEDIGAQEAFEVGDGLELHEGTLSAATLKRTVDQMSVDKVDKKFGAANAGKLLHVGESGDLDLLQVGEGLALENGVMSAEPEGTWELIERATLDEEVSQVQFTGLALKAFRLVLSIPKGESVATSADFKFHINGISTGYRFMFASYSISPTTKRSMTAMVYPVCDRMMALHTTGDGAENESVWSSIKLAGKCLGGYPAGVITSIMGGNLFPAGTSIIVEGVRANA